MVEPSNFIRDFLSDANLNPLVKPEVAFGNYFFRWDDRSLGLYSDEVTKFKSFIKDMIPHLEPLMKAIETLRPKNGHLKKTVFDRALFSISGKYNSHTVFVLNIDNFGSTLFFREERIRFNDELHGKMRINYEPGLILLDKLKGFDNKVSVKWKLGELLFDRGGRKKNMPSFV
jgi:hypothetical protein